MNPMSPFKHVQQQKKSVQSTPAHAFGSPDRASVPTISPVSGVTMGDMQTNLEHVQRFGYSLDRLPLSNTPKANNTGLPDRLKAGVEHLSGIAMDDVRVHYNSLRPAEVQAWAYTQGTDIHVGPGQEKHLAHEAWHVAQQKEGRVRPTWQAKGIAINDDTTLEQEADVMGEKALRQTHVQRPIQQFGSLLFQYTRVQPTITQPSRQAMHVSSANLHSQTTRSAVIQRDPFDPTRSAAEQALQNTVNAIAPVPNTPHIVNIGAQQAPGGLTGVDERHFDNQMLRTLQNVLTRLPSQHIKGNLTLDRIVMMHDTGNGASYYGDGTLNIVVPFDKDSWAYLHITKWPLGDLATTALTLYGQEALNPLNAFTHDIIGTGGLLNKLKMIPENFLEWLIPHELGHAVDDAIGWDTNRHYRNPACAAWDKYLDPNEEMAMYQTILASVFPAANDSMALNQAFNQYTHTFPGYTSISKAISKRKVVELNPSYRTTALQTFETTVQGGTRKVDYMENIIRSGLNRPWEHGGGAPLANRTYQLDTQHDKWVSYESNKYSLRDSNYQFSNPSEWFAETYAHYFTPPWGNRVKDIAARNWFKDNLDPINTTLPRAGFISRNRLLKRIPGPVPPPPIQNPAIPPTFSETVIKGLQDTIVSTVRIPADLIERSGGVVIGTVQVAAILGEGLLRKIGLW
jgi:hypothetical protein